MKSFPFAPHLFSQVPYDNNTYEMPLDTILWIADKQAMQAVKAGIITVEQYCDFVVTIFA
jgi:hypothetical protein